MLSNQAVKQPLFRPLTTSASETITATGTNNVINGTQLTLNAGDTIVGSVSGTNKLSLVDSGTAAWTPTAASITNVQTVALRNINGTAATAAVKNVTQTTFGTTVVSATAGTIITFANVATADVVVTPAVSATHTGQTLAILAAAAINAATGSLYVATVVDNTMTLTAKTAGAVTAVTGVLTLSAASTGAISQVTTVAGAAVVNTAGAADTVDATKFGGATSFENDVSTSQVDFTGLTAAQSVRIIGNGTTTNGATTVAWGATVTSGTVNISGGTTAGAITTSGTSLVSNTVNSTGVANTVGALTLGAAVTSLTLNATTNLTTGAITNTGAAALTTLTINGAGAVDISAGALQSTVTTVNAAGNSGGVTVLLGSAQTNKFTGGSGNDVVTTGAVLTTGTADGGAGTADVVDVGANVTHINTTALAAKYTNFEVLRINGIMDMSLFPTYTAVQLSGPTNSITNMTATQAANVQARADIGNTTLTLATATGTSDVLTITAGLGNTTATAVNNATSITTLTATGFETINLIANPSSTVALGAAGRTSSITAISNSSLTGVNLSGTAWTLGDIASSKATAWNASALTGNGASTSVGLTLSATGAAFAGSVVTGSSLRDDVTMNSTTGVTFNLGAGSDYFTTTAVLLTPSGAATDNTINAEGGTGDRLTLTADTGAVTATDTTFTKVTGFEALRLAGAATDISVTGLGAGFLSAFATGVTVTDVATQSDGEAYTWASGLYSQNVNLTHVTDAVGTTSAANQSITTGAGTDTIVLTASSFTGATAGVTQGQIAVSTGAGADTITVGVGTLDTAATARAVTITGGTGADIISITSVNGTAGTGVLANTGFVIAAGDSTTTAYDQITGFKLSDIGGAGGKVSDLLDFAGTGAITTYGATAATGYTAAELTVAVTAAGANGGLTVFGGSAASGLTLAQKIAAIQSVVNITNGDTCFFIDTGNTYVFNNNSAGDSIVQLVGVGTVGRLIVTNDATTDNGLFIA